MEEQNDDRSVISSYHYEYNLYTVSQQQQQQQQRSVGASRLSV